MSFSWCHLQEKSILEKVNKRTVSQNKLDDTSFSFFFMAFMSLHSLWVGGVIIQELLGEEDLAGGSLSHTASRNIRSSQTVFSTSRTDFRGEKQTRRPESVRQSVYEPTSEATRGECPKNRLLTVNLTSMFSSGFSRFDWTRLN